ncbi:hypothetical protein TNCV_5047361 [Trichonephila clavipes]|nr:hypothetical protein TNCV_5047361 [Trichonephila clavipes]
MMHCPKPPSQKIELTSESFQKCEALCYRGGAKHLLAACLRRLFYNALQSFRRVAQYTPELKAVPFGIKPISKTTHRSQNTVDIILHFHSACLALTLTGENRCRHFIDFCFVSGEIWDTHGSSPVTIRLNMSSPSSS